MEQIKKESDDDAMFQVTSAPPSTSTLFKVFIKLAIPGITSNVLGFTMYMLNSVFAGRLGDPEILAAMGLGYVCAVVFFITMFMGLNAP